MYGVSSNIFGCDSFTNHKKQTNLTTISLTTSSSYLRVRELTSSLCLSELTMGSTDKKLHVVFLPYLAPGHMMPMLNIARLFATAHGVHATIITTTLNAQRFKPTIFSTLNNNITLQTLPFPSTEAGLPEGCENLIDTPNPETTIKIFRAINMLEPQIKTLIHQNRPDCIFSDVLFPWTSDVAAELNIPRLAFSGSGFFNLSLAHAVESYRPQEGVDSDNVQFVVPNLPDRVMLTRSQLPDIVKSETKFSEFFEKLKAAERKSFGMVVNSFYGLELGYADYYRKAMGIKAWHVGPVELFKICEDYKDERGDKECVERHRCLGWLDSKRESSVLYVCFGSLTRFSKAQLMELGCALEDCCCCFIWVVPKELKLGGEEVEEGGEWWLPEGFEERMEESGKGMIIKGWAPQVLILEHPGIGGFLTHCGWNSILEGVAAGLPLITWPIMADQFYNEKLVTQVLKFGVMVGNEDWKIWATEETTLIGRNKIGMAMRRVMGGGDEAEEMKNIAKKLGELAKKAVEEGGSSYNDLNTLIQDIKMYKSLS
ncbi:unnamed protein product [Camellia sinensis]